MSRSYKKHPFVVDHHARTTKQRKRIANKTIRQDKDFDINGSAYKKRRESWDICDYRYIWTREDAIEMWYREEDASYRYSYAWIHDKFGTLEAWLNYWEKCVKRK